MKKWLLFSAALAFFNIFVQCVIYLSNPEISSISAMLGWCALCWIGAIERMEVKQ
jgi:hypothetical protein